MSLHIRTTCRLCDGPTQVALELPPTPPANELVTREFVESGQKQDVFPLTVMTCTKCGHVQLREVVAPERLFKATPYRSGASPVYREHLRKYAEDVMDRFGVPRFVVEIGSNDGTFLKHFQERGSDELGVDPFDGEIDYCLIRRPFSSGLARDIIRQTWPGKRAPDGGADLITANHVFAHADDLRDIALGVRELLSDDGTFVFEVGYLVDVLEKTLFDVIYHEHVSYHHLAPLIPFFERMGLNLFDAERVDTQGGAIRCYVNKKPDGRISDRLGALLEDEGSGSMQDAIRMMGLRIGAIRRELLELMRSLQAKGARIAGYGAPAKCVTLMHTLGFGADVLDFIVDDNPVKHELFTPGKHVEIRPVSALYESHVDQVLILAWNFAESIMNAHPKFRFVIPLPRVEIFDPSITGGWF